MFNLFLYFRDMEDKISTVKNPLTVIAIFAGTTEISGTAILPFLEPNNQNIYLWFLMIFPLILILLFFLTLNFNHKVLYAPSDFSNEDNFVDLIKNATVQEIFSKAKEEAREGESSREKVPISNIEKSNNELILSNNGSSNSMKKIEIGEMIELWILSELEKELKIPIKRNVKIESGFLHVIFDGVARKGPNLIGVEVKYLKSKKSLSTSIWERMYRRLKTLNDFLSETQLNTFSVIFAVVTDEDCNEMRSLLENKFKEFRFPVHIRVYNFEEVKANFAD